MPHPLFTALLTMLFLSSDSLAEENPRLEAKRIIDTATADVKKNRDACEKANEKPVEDARRALQELAARLLEDGDTSGATAVLKKIETLKADVLGKPASIPPRPPVVEKPAPQKPLLERLAGRWSTPLGGTYHTIERSGVTQEVFPTGKIHQGGQLKVMPDGSAEVEYPGGFRRRFSEVRGDTLAVETWNPDGSVHSSGVVYRTE